MAKTVNKKIIQEAIRAELSKQLIVEGPVASGIFDAPARAVGAVGNIFANIGGQMKLGAINKQLDRTAERIEVDWKKAEDVATKLASKMQASRNPQIANGGQQAAQNIASAGNDIRNATNKLRSLSKNGADKAAADSSGSRSDDSDPDFQDKIKKDKFGTEYTETPVDRFIHRYGGDPEKLGTVQRGHLERLFMELVSNGINPFKVPKDKISILQKYSEFRNAQISNTGEDPFPNFEHFEKVLGKDAADELRVKNNPNKKQNKQDKEVSPQQSVEQDDVEEVSADNNDISPALTDYIAKARNVASSKGVNPNMIDKWMVPHLEKIKYLPSLKPQDKAFSDKLIIKGGGRPSNSFGGGDFKALGSNTPGVKSLKKVPRPQSNLKNPPAPLPLTQKKGQLPLPPMLPQQQAQAANVNQMKPQAAQAQQAVKQAPIKAVGTPPPPMDMPKQEVGEPVMLPKMTDFFGLPPEPMDPKALPVPPTEKEQDLQDLMKNPGGKWNEFKKKYPKSEKEDLSSMLPVPPPVEDMGDQVQVGNVEQPAFQPPPQKPEPASSKKKVSAKRKKT